MNVIILCEESQAVCLAFRNRGHNAFSCDLQKCSGGHPEFHFNISCWDVLKCGLLELESGKKIEIEKWDLVIGHPPCTYLCSSGEKWFNIDTYWDQACIRWSNRLEAVKFFFKMWKLGKKIGKVCLENPVGYINSILKPSQIIHPYYFGDEFQKTTCLWIYGLPLLYHNKEDNIFFNKTHVCKQEVNSKWILSLQPSEDRSKLRSKTFQGIANAMAEQWG